MSSTRLPMLSLLVLAFFLGACAGRQAVPPTPAPPTPLPSPSAASPAPSGGALPDVTRTLTPAPSSSATPALTASPTLPADFSAAEVTWVESGIGGARLTVRLPGVDTAYAVNLDGIPFRCALDPAQPDRLFCTGLTPPHFDVPVTLQFIEPLSGAILYEAGLTLQASLFPTPVYRAYNSENWCPLRGEDVRCETECRLLDSGDACIVSTCTDRCGYYFSINTCPDDMKIPAPKCSPEQWDYLRNLYGLPDY